VVVVVVVVLFAFDSAVALDRLMLPLRRTIKRAFSLPSLRIALEKVNN
jgi:ABC-type Fe3+ transport system permease subunit